MTFCQSQGYRYTLDIGLYLQVVTKVDNKFRLFGYGVFGFLDEKTVEIVKGGCYVVYV